MLAFAAGALIYVVVEELIPEASEGEHSNLGTIAFAIGVALMMLLDVALGYCVQCNICKSKVRTAGRMYGNVRGK